MLCCFYTTDATNVSLQLGSLENLLKRYVKAYDHSALFSSSDFTLKFNGQAAPVKKGRSLKVIHETSETMTTYARTAMRKLRSLNPKHLAVEFAESPGSPQPAILPQAVTPAQQQQSYASPSSDKDDTPRIQTVEENLANQSQRLTRLEECCGMLADSSKALQTQLSDMNTNMNSRMNEMAEAIEKLYTSPNRKNTKAQKPYDRPTMDLDF